MPQILIYLNTYQVNEINKTNGKSQHSSSSLSPSGTGVHRYQKGGQGSWVPNESSVYQEHISAW